MLEDHTIYYESHITIEPLFGVKLGEAAAIGRAYGYKMADLFFQKRVEDTLERSRMDSFMTGHSKEMRDIVDRQRSCVVALITSGVNVFRYKVEHVIIDSREVDVHGIFKRANEA